MTTTEKKPGLPPLTSKWSKVDDRIYLCERRVKIGKREHLLIFRIDGREGLYRVDVARPIFNIWEAIDGGEGFKTVRAAQVWVSSWTCAAVVQEDLTPRMTREEGSEP
jgi:hypothetical protein